MRGLNWSEAQLSAHLRGSATCAKTQVADWITKNRSRATYVDGIRFPSQLQAKHFEQLKLLKAAGVVKFFLREVRFDLPGGTYHRVDWLIVLPNGQYLWAESKGRDLRPGQIKRRQVEELYGVTIDVWTRDVELPIAA